MTRPLYCDVLQRCNRMCILAWLLHDGMVVSVLVGASRPQQLLDNIGALRNTSFSEEELRRIDEISLR